MLPRAVTARVIEAGEALAAMRCIRLSVGTESVNAMRPA
jgi:hypothetical protein